MKIAIYYENIDGICVPVHLGREYGPNQDDLLEGHRRLEKLKDREPSNTFVLVRTDVEPANNITV